MVRRSVTFGGLAGPVVLGLVAALLSGSCQAAPAEPSPKAEAARVERLKVQVLAGYPHDTEAFTQGLELRDGVLYEGTGRTGESQLRTVEPETGKVRDRASLPTAVFGEGITVVGERVWQLTYHNGFAFLRDRDTLAEIRRVDYDGQGWGICHDPVRRRLVMSNGQAALTFRDPETFAPLSTVPVTRDGRPLKDINELECVGGKVWANIWRTDEIVRIDPGSGRVEAVVDASGLLSAAEGREADVLNGIAATPEPGVFLITGKLWPKVFRVRFVPDARQPRQRSSAPAGGQAVQEAVEREGGAAL
jgi:glutamine cyclotransferase